MKRHTLSLYLSVVILLFSTSSVALESPSQTDFLHLTEDSLVETAGLNGMQFANGFSFSGWFNFKQLHKEQRYLVGNNWENLALESVGDGSLNFWFLQRTFEIEELPMNVWFNLAVTLKGTTVRFFLNGTLVEEVTADTSVISFPDSEHDRFVLGAYWGNAKQFKIWDRGLDQGEIQEQIALIDSAPSNPLYQWLLDDGVGNVMTDTGRNANADFIDQVGRVFWSNENSPYEVLAQSHLVIRTPEPLVHVWGVADFDQDGRKEIFVHGPDDYQFPDQEAMLILEVGEDNSLTDVSEQLIDGGLYYKNYPSGRETVVADFNSDGFDDIFYVNSAGHGAVIHPELPSLLLSDGVQGKLFPSEHTIKAPPCTLTSPAFSGQKPCQVSDANGVLYPDPNAPLVDMDNRATGHSGASGDIDGDGDLDLFNMVTLGAERDEKPVAPYFLINDGQGGFTANWQMVPFKAFTYWTELFALPDGSQAMRDSEYPIAHLEDFDGDGYLDMALFGEITDAVRQLPPATPFSVETEREWESIYDLIAWGNEDGFSEEYTILYPRNMPVPDAGGPNSHALSIDIEGDGDQDLIVGRDRPWWVASAGHYIQIFRNEGNRIFVDRTSELIPQSIEQISERPAVRGLQEFDFNKDGCPDFALSAPPQFIAEGNKVNPYRLWLNDCTGKFTPILDSFIGKMGLLLPIDIDQDGGLDFVSLDRGFNFGPYITATVIKQIGEPKLEYFVDTDGDGVMDAYESSGNSSINTGHSGAWYNPATSGQGGFIDIDPVNRFMFLSWFTFTPEDADHPDEVHWFTAQGNYSGNTAVLDVYETTGGQFNQPQSVDTKLVGSAMVTFNNCETGQMTYDLTAWDKQGEFPIQRAIPGTENVCEQLSTSTTQSVDINAGMDGSWYDPATAGQGFFLDAHAPSGGDGFLFLSWFTFGDDTDSGLRWLTAQGGYSGPTAELEVYETTGGRFDDAQVVNTVKIGTATVTFSDCSNAQVAYNLPDEGKQGEIEVTRALPGSSGLCEAATSAR